LSYYFININGNIKYYLYFSNLVWNHLVLLFWEVFNLKIFANKVLKIIMFFYIFPYFFTFTL